MGDRVSIQFKKGDMLSAILLSQNDGVALVYLATDFVAELKKFYSGKGSEPIDRLDPHIILVDFISGLKPSPRNGVPQHITSNYRISYPPHSPPKEIFDAGHWIIDIDTGEATCETKRL